MPGGPPLGIVRSDVLADVRAGQMARLSCGHTKVWVGASARGGVGIQTKCEICTARRQDELQGKD